MKKRRDRDLREKLCINAKDRNRKRNNMSEKGAKKGWPGRARTEDKDRKTREER